jgi:2-polyprenyl-3-methyl-5-hydroxy-6-metoxy-1,4-benzoquinol methylase
MKKIKLFLNWVLGRWGYCLVSTSNRSFACMNAVEYNTVENVENNNLSYERWSKNRQKDGLFIKKLIPLLLNYFKDASHLNLLDVGCGTGVLVIELLKVLPGSQIKGCDFSENKISHCKNHYEVDDVFFVFDLLKDEINERYDCVTCTEVLEHLLYPHLALEKLQKLVNSSGVMILTVPDGRLDSFSGHINFWSMESFKVFLENMNKFRKYEADFFYIEKKIVAILRLDT